MLTIWIICAGLCLISFARTRNVVINVGQHEVSFKILNTYIIIGCLILLMTANRTGYDADAYSRFYNFVKASGYNPYDYTYEMFFRVEETVLKFLPNLSYHEFHALILLASFMLLILPVLKKYSLSPVTVLSLYVLSGVFASDGMQSKNFIAACFLIAAMHFLVNIEEYKRNIIIYYLLIVVAMTFHFSFFIYLFLPITKFKRFRNIIRWFPICGVFLYFAFLLTGIGSKILLVLSRFFILSKLESYSLARAGIRSIVPLFIYLAVLITLRFFSDRASSGSFYAGVGTEAKRNSIREYLVNVRYIWEFMGIFLPILVYANASYRLYRNLYIPVFIVLANCVECLGSKHGRTIGYLMTITLALIMFLYPILLRQQIDIYLPILDGDFFWQN